MYPGPAPAALPFTPPPPRPPRARRPRRPTDPVAAVAGNATMLGLGYLLMRRPLLAALALAGTGFLLWSAAVQTENPLWRYLLPAWGLAMILHARWLTRRDRPERLADIAGADPTARTRTAAVTAAALVVLALCWFRLDAWWTVHDAETAHAGGDCTAATAAVDELDAVHRVAYGPGVLRAEQERDACGLLLAALTLADAAGAEGLAEYMDHPGALWDGAGPRRAAFLLDAAMAAGTPEPDALDEAFTQLSATLADLPAQSGAVRGVVEDFLTGLADEQPCAGHAVDEWIAAGAWDEPAITEPIAAAADRVPVRLLDCARVRAEAGDVQGAGALYREFLTDYPGHERAAEAADGILDSGGYCANPVAYAGAPEYAGDGPHPMRLLGWTAAGRGFPDSWLADTADATELVVCVDAEVGEFQDSCMYRTPSGSTFFATFYAHRFTISAYSLRTGELVSEYSREIGDPCPDRLDGTYSTVYLASSSDFLSMASEYSDEDFRGMFTDLVA